MIDFKEACKIVYGDRPMTDEDKVKAIWDILERETTFVYEADNFVKVFDKLQKLFNGLDKNVELTTCETHCDRHDFTNECLHGIVVGTR